MKAMMFQKTSMYQRREGRNRNKSESMWMIHSLDKEAKRLGVPMAVHNQSLAGRASWKGIRMTKNDRLNIQGFQKNHDKAQIKCLRNFRRK
jgi:hypothetical protein